MGQESETPPSPPPSNPPLSGAWGTCPACPPIVMLLSITELNYQAHYICLMQCVETFTGKHDL